MFRPEQNVRSTIADLEKNARKPTANNLDATRAYSRVYMAFTPTGPAMYSTVVLYPMTEDNGAAMVFRYSQEQVAAVHEIIGTFGTINGEHVQLTMESAAQHPKCALHQ
jgi:hypothetical protein